MTLSETAVFNGIRAYLAKNEFKVIQLVPPGGQAPISITFDDGTRRRTCYPDLIAIKNDCLLIGELKPGYSQADHQKLKLILDCAADELRHSLKSWAPNSETDLFNLIGVLCHSNAAALPATTVHQLVVAANEDVHHIPPQHPAIHNDALAYPWPDCLRGSSFGTP
jgi:hypothetical protein